jgi:hypothetical protein
MDPSGNVAGAALQKGFQYAITDNRGRHELLDGIVL